MSPAFWFWILFVLSLLFSGWGAFRPDPPKWYGPGVSLVLWLLLGLLGWATFGSLVK